MFENPRQPARKTQPVPAKRERGQKRSQPTRPKCTHCGARVRVANNPFYGTGLAVHKTIIHCDQCQRIRLVNTRQEPVALPVTQPSFLKRSKTKAASTRTK